MEEAIEQLEAESFGIVSLSCGDTMPNKTQALH